MGRPVGQHPSILKTKTKRPRWYFRFVTPVFVDRSKTKRKEQRPIYLGFCDEMGKRAAEKIRDEKLRSINNTPLVIQSQVLMKDLVEAYKTGYLPGLKPSTRHGYEHLLNKHVLPPFGKLRLCDVDALKVQQWIYAMEDSGLGKATRKNALAVLRSVYDAAEEWGYFVGRNPCKKKKIGGGGGKTYDLRPLEPSEALLLLQVLADHQPLGLIVEIALFTGLRVGEILGLAWAVVDFKRASLEVRQARSQQGELAEPKTPRGRRKVDLGPLVKKLVQPADANDADLIWPGEDYFSLQQKFRNLAKKAGIEFTGFGFHTLRRTYASWRDELGLATKPDAGLVRDMGHSSGGMTKKYITSRRTGVVEQLHNLVYFATESEGPKK